LGYHPHSDQFRRTNDEPEMHYPLRVLMCRTCGLAQLSYVVEPEVMYTEDYLYEASITATAAKHWEELVEDVMHTTHIKGGRSVDIGGNDGTLALKFQNHGFQAVNVDPCQEVAQISKDRGVKTFNTFFNKTIAEEIGKVDVITGTNVFAHVNDLDAFIEAVKVMMKDKSVFIFESPYFGEFLKGLEYDTVYHQHLSYLSVRPVAEFLSKHGLEIFSVKFSELHGGAFRCYIGKKGQWIPDGSVLDAIKKETWTEQELIAWGMACKLHMEELFELVYTLYKDGQTIACVSSPAKGMTLLNSTGIGKYISFITEKSKLKIGRYTPGTKLKIVSDAELIAKQPDYAIILAWNFSKEIMANNPHYKGKWIVPLPKVTII
jgi:SAM-dependent methyltransferase